MNAVPASAAAGLEPSSRAARMLRPLLNVLLPETQTHVVVRSGAAQGIRLRIDPRREKYYWTGVHELGVQEAFTRLLEPGAVVWDVGAHIGFFTALAARRVGPEGHVHAFEPMRANRARLMETVWLNQLEHVSVHDAAVAGRAGVAWLYGHSATSMWSLVAETRSSGVEVPCVTLDGLFADPQFADPALIKIDAEGAELEILGGGHRLITDTSVALIVEFSEPRDLDVARSLYPDRKFHPLTHKHWLMSSSA